MKKKLTIAKHLLMLIFHISLILIGISLSIAGLIIMSITKNELYMFLGLVLTFVCMWFSDPGMQYYMIKYELMSEAEQQIELERVKKKYYETLEREKEAKAKLIAFCSAVKGIKGFIN